MARGANENEWISWNTKDIYIFCSHCGLSIRILFINFIYAFGTFTPSPITRTNSTNSFFESSREFSLSHSLRFCLSRFFFLCKVNTFPGSFDIIFVSLSDVRHVVFKWINANHVKQTNNGKMNEKQRKKEKTAENTKKKQNKEPNAEKAKSVECERRRNEKSKVHTFKSVDDELARTIIVNIIIERQNAAEWKKGRWTRKTFFILRNKTIEPKKLRQIHSSTLIVDMRHATATVNTTQHKQ